MRVDICVDYTTDEASLRLTQRESEQNHQSATDDQPGRIDLKAQLHNQSQRRANHR